MQDGVLYFHCIFGLTYDFNILSEADSATRACRSARTIERLVSERDNPHEKLMLQDFGRIDSAPPGNRLRDMQRLLQSRGFMPNIPTSWIKKAPEL